MCHGSLSTCVGKSGASKSCAGPYGPIYIYSIVLRDIPILPLIPLPLAKHRIAILVTSSIHSYNE
jgi:hypothetical protein